MTALLRDLIAKFEENESSEESAHDRMERIKDAPDKLIQAYDKLYGNPKKLEVEDIVYQIEDLRAYKYPKKGFPAIVVETFESRRLDRQEGQAIMFVDCRIGLLDGDGDYVEFEVDSRRFETFKAGE